LWKRRWFWVVSDIVLLAVIGAAGDEPSPTGSDLSSEAALDEPADDGRRGTEDDGYRMREHQKLMQKAETGEFR
jgi:hypothetical protein